MDGPPPPPPHGDKPNTTEGEYRKSSDLPPGNYDIFIVPPHSAGSGFLYLPSLQCHRNSFLAGAASTLFVVLLWTTLAPIFRAWYTATVTTGGGMGMVLLALGVGVAGWAVGASQSDSFNGNNSNGHSGGAGGSNAQNNRPGANFFKGKFGNGAGQQQQGGDFGGKSTRGNQQYAGNQHGANNTEWERARDETKRKEELRRKMEEFKKKREADAKEKEKQKEREAMEKELKERREQLEKEVAAAKEKAEKEAREKMEKEAAEAREKQAKTEAEAKEKAEKEAAEKAAAAKAQAQKEAMARFAALKEAATKKYAERKAQDGKASSQPGSAPRTPSPKKPPFPTARTATEEDDAYSFRPYDRPRRPYAAASSVYSESSYSPSQSTARTTPPPSHRGPYTTKDPDKIVIQGVYQFTNAFMKTPVAQLVSGQGMVTDGLVLRMTTEGLFIDDDLRGVGQREWDVKAWTLKLAEVWCAQTNATTPANAKSGSSNPFSFGRKGNAHSVPTSEESDAYLAGLLKVCKNSCRQASPSAAFARSATASGFNEGGPVHPPQSEFRGLHVLRASLRDQEGKRYVFVISDTEAWKIAIGLQRLRSGSQVRAMGVSALPLPECKSVLTGLGYL
ncbi:hypothetical protein N7510_001973 [Penicillium lagena]|uniref:uncharacterized protein n=1 Tax=Penicillium lagena TaxID=94218 RepID=UPI002540FE88|nr:uncharacterized protein N7510_001973 [Penicillium lagena]KAJ5625664.1 hypothetical protein N7510_001973 [Penicillium lagena]